MPRKARNMHSQRLYHIMVQGLNREYIFNTYNFKNRYLSLLRDKLGNYNSIVISYCIMDNHAHFLLYAENAKDISELFQRINGAYSNYYNKIKNRVGYVFRDRFLSQEISDVNGIVNCIKYIHNNPVKANMVSCAEKYYFSSYSEYKNHSSEVIDFYLANAVLNQVKNKEVIFEEDNSTDYNFIDVSKYDRDYFYHEYIHQIDISKLKQNKKELKEEILRCAIKMDVPVKELAKVFDVPDKTIYCWIKRVNFSSDKVRK